jgi:hypothetical protein
MLVCGVGGLLDGYYNYRVTGNAFLMPYAVYYQEYQRAPPWIIFSEREPPVYRHTDIEKAFGHEVEGFRNERSNLLVNLRALRGSASFYGSPLLLFPLAVAILLSASYRLWTAAGIYLLRGVASLLQLPSFLITSRGA